MNSFMSWVGGKKALRDAIVARHCCSCDRYVEVFGGGGWVLFHKRPGKFEVYNDFNPKMLTRTHKASTPHFRNSPSPRQAKSTERLKRSAERSNLSRTPTPIKASVCISFPCM